ncbi:MAG: alpha-galactosidase [Eubacteriales bacterium]|nr:alpha-galactosidase [Eubacteriales bacterium]
MELYVELKLRGDEANGGFSNGLTMCGSQSVRELELVEDAERVRRYRDGRGHCVSVATRQIGEAQELVTTFENQGTEPVVLDMLSSFAIRDIPADRIHRMQSFWSAEGKPRTETVEELGLEPSWAGFGLRSEKFGNLGSMPVRKYFPFVVLEDSREGRFVGIQLYAPSSWQIELLCEKDENLAVVGGIADHDYGHWGREVAPGERFSAPRALLAQGDSLYEVCHKLTAAQQPEISARDQEMGILFNEYCTTWGSPSLENVRKICDRIKGRGIQFMVIDAGWYGQTGNWGHYIGDWDVNTEVFPGGLKAAADYIRSCGMIPGLWFELESVGRASQYWNATEHLLQKDGVPITVGDRRFWDMEDPWVVDYLSRKVIGQLKEAGFGYVKVDYNETIGVGCDGTESLGEGLRRKVKATQAFFARMKEEIPDLVFELCSSGGHRLEPSFLELASQASFSDAHETVTIPLIAANLHRVMQPRQSQIWAVLRAADSLERIQYSMVNTFLGRMCLSGDIYDLSDSQWQAVEEGMDFYRQAADIIRDGETVSCLCNVRSYAKPCGEQVLVRRLGARLLVIAHRFGDSQEPEMQILQGKRILCEYGTLTGDFTAKAWICEETAE